jgi:transposase InsO family protein
MAKKIYTVRFRQEFIDRWTRYTGAFIEHCDRWGVSRQSGYDWLDKVHIGGFDGLETKSSAPHHCPHATTDEIVELVIAARKLHPTWGPRKLRPWLLTRHPDAELPAPSTMGEVLKRAGLVPKRRRRKRLPRYSEPFSAVEAPNDVWTADFKGQFHTRDGLLCYPLTIADAHSRFLIRCDAYLSPDATAKASFESAFREHGLPSAIRTDNGTPFVGSRSPAGLSALSVWWIHLGITPERITPASPWENGRHERMHRTLKEETTQPAQANRNVQQRVFNAFRYEFNHERPHESLGQKPPVTAYNNSSRPYPKKLPELQYPDDYELRRVSASGHFGWRSHKLWLTETLAGEIVGLKPASERTWEVYFGPILLGTLSEDRPSVGLIRVPD